MSWQVHDEWLDLAQSRHVVVFRNSATGALHHLVHHFALQSCPHCGQAQAPAEPLDFHQKKSETMAALNDHHKKTMQYRELHPHVRLGSGPKK